MDIAVIPARGGSKRIPRKNVRPFAGRPMITYAISAALQSRLFAHVIVSTDDQEIADIAREAGAGIPFMRPANISDDHTPTVPVMAHAIRSCQALDWSLDLVTCIYPGVPLLEPLDLIEAAALARRRPGKYVFPVAPYPSPIQRALRRYPDGATEPLDPTHVSTRTQDLDPAYHDAGQFYCASADTWLSGRSVHGNACSIVIPEWRCVDIDAPDDWKRAEALYRALRTDG